MTIGIGWVLGPPMLYVRAGAKDPAESGDTFLETIGVGACRMAVVRGGMAVGVRAIGMEVAGEGIDAVGFPANIDVTDVRPWGMVVGGSIDVRDCADFLEVDFASAGGGSTPLRRALACLVTTALPIRPDAHRAFIKALCFSLLVMLAVVRTSDCVTNGGSSLLIPSSLSS